MTRFSTNKQHWFQRFVYIYSCCHGNGTYISFTIQKPKFVLLPCLLPLLVTEGSRVLEKKVNETQVTKTVFNHLKEIQDHSDDASNRLLNLWPEWIHQSLRMPLVSPMCQFVNNQFANVWSHFMNVLCHFANAYMSVRQRPK